MTSNPIVLPVLLLGVVTFAAGKLTCEGSASGEYLTLGDYCYVRGESSMRFGVAEALCHEDLASLASVHSEKENRLVASFGDEVIIGLHNVSNLMQWTDGSPLDYTNFASGEAERPLECVKMINGLWYNIQCSEKVADSVCKKKLVEIPDSPTDQCPPADVIYSDHGTIYSPGYPNNLNFSQESDCYYYLKGMEGYKVVLDVEYFDNYRDTFLKIYEGWNANDSKLLAKINYVDFVDIVSTKDSNMMLVVFHVPGPCCISKFWKLVFYTEHAHPATINPSISTTTQANSPSCAPALEEDVGTLQSPGFPFSYETGISCMYYIKLEGTELQIEVVELNIGADDFIEISDLRSGEIVESTKMNMVEGFEFTANFPIGIRFESGNIPELFGRWRISMSEWIKIPVH